MSYYYGARYYDPKTSIWLSVDPLAEQMPEWSSYNYTFSNPIKYTDPTGMAPETSPIFDQYGNYLGVDSEGYSGKIIIMSQEQFDSLGGEGMDHQEALDCGFTMDNAGLNRDAELNIFNHIAKEFDGLELQDGTKYDYDKINKGIQNTNVYNTWSTSYSKKEMYIGTFKLQYEKTVENIASTIINHEYFSHLINDWGSTGGKNSHRKSFESVISHPLFEKTTSNYKYYNLFLIDHFTREELGKGLSGKYLKQYNENKNEINNYHNKLLGK